MRNQMEASTNLSFTLLGTGVSVTVLNASIVKKHFFQFVVLIKAQKDVEILRPI